MRSVTVEVHTDGVFRASEIMADLRNIAEVLFHPMRCVGFWDGPTGGHICPQLQRGQQCSHGNRPPAEALENYQRTVEDELHGVLEVVFPHADTHIYLA